MATDSNLSEKRLNANRKNAQHSTGPRTDPGKAISSCNALTLGLFTQSDYVRPEEQTEYRNLCARCVTELNPEGVLEESFLTAIVSARWRLRRCALVERQFAGDPGRADPMHDPYRQDFQASIDRARSRAFSLLARAAAELRRLQTDRTIAKQLLPNAEQLPALAGAKQILTAIDVFERAGNRRAINRKNQKLSSQAITGVQNELSMGSNCNPAHQDTPRTARNAACPCGSGEKFKRCCGKLVPPVLGKVA